MPNLERAEVFATGKWNGIEFDERDLDEIAENFEQLKDKHHVPLKLGHNKEQKITDGQPALGWVKRVYREGKKLFADFTDMPNVIYEAMKKRLYRTVSIELLFKVDHEGKRYNQVLDAIALLGADHPAVNSLADLQTLTASRIRFTEGRRLSFGAIAGEATEEKALNEEEVKKLIASAVQPLETANAELRKENKELRDKVAADEREKADFARKENEKKVKEAREGVTKVLDDAVRDKRITPAFRETYAKQIGVADDERVLTIDIKDVESVCKFTKSKEGETGLHDPNRNEDFEDPEAELLSLTRREQEAGETFEAAFMRTARANPKLHKAYLDMNGERGVS